MANNLDTATLLSIAKNRNKLMRLAEGIKTRKKANNKRSLNLKRDPAYTNIEHLVFGTYRPRSSTPDDYSRKDPPPDGDRRQTGGATPELFLRADRQSDTTLIVDGTENMSPHRKAAQSNVSSPIADDKTIDAPERRASIPLQCISDKENKDYSQEHRTTHDKSATNSEKTDTENLEPAWNIADGTMTNGSIDVVKNESFPSTNQRLPPHRWKEKLHNTSLPARTNDNEFNDKFVRQNTYPSGIPRPRIHVKHNLAPMRNPLPKPTPQQSRCTTPLAKSTPVRQDVRVIDQRKSLVDEKPAVRSTPAVRSSVRGTTKTNLTDTKTKSSSKSSLSSSHSSLSGGKSTVNLTNRKNEAVTRAGFTRSQSYCRSTDKTVKTNGIVPSQVRRTVQRQPAQNRQAVQATRSVVRQQQRPSPTGERREKDALVTTTSNGIQQNKSVKSPNSDLPRSIPRFQTETTKNNVRESGLPVRSTQNGIKRTVRSVSVDSGRLMGSTSLHLSPVGNGGQIKHAAPDSKVARPVLKKSSTVDIGALSHKISNQCEKIALAEPVRTERDQLMSDIDEKDEKSSSGTSKSPTDDRLRNDGINRRSASLPKSFLLEKYGLNGKKLTPTQNNDSLGLERLLQVGEELDNNCPDLKKEEEMIYRLEDKLNQENMKMGIDHLSANSVSGTENKESIASNKDGINETVHNDDSANSACSEKCLTDEPQIEHVPVIRNRFMSRSERRLKATSSPEFRTNNEFSSSVRDVYRPWSEVYTEQEAQKLLQKSSPSCDIVNIQRLNNDSDSSCLAFSLNETAPVLDGRFNALRLLNSRLSSTDSMLQKFRKSFSLRFQRTRKTDQVIRINDLHENKEFQQNISDTDITSSPPMEKHSTTLYNDQSIATESGNVFQLGSVVLRSAKERKKDKPRKSNSKCYSADSGIQIEVMLSNNDVFLEESQAAETPALIRRRAASTSESSPKIKPPPRPHSDVGSSLNGNSSVVEAFMAQLSRQRDTVPELKRHSSDSGTPLRKTPSVERQLSTPSFIKIRTDKSRPLKRSRGQSRLRRSISQPLDLEKIGLATKTTGYSDHEGSHDISTASSEDDFSSDGESYNSSLTPSRGQPIFREFSDDGITYAEALWDHVTIDAEELAFHAGEVIEVTDSSDKDWWWGSIGPRSGWFPAAFVRLRVNQEDTVEDCISKMGDGTLMRQPPRKMSVSLLSNEQVRANVVQEIVSTERDFVQHLKDVVEGYLRQVRRRSDMFSDDRVATIFGNIEEIYQFQSNFLKHLEACIDVERPHLSQIGNCFLEHKEEFEIYSEYCNNHPLAVSELQELYADSKYIHFFEACRLLQEMIDISLDGFLLTPVQKICKYPLQLAELLKYTKPDHQDFLPVTKALAAMREVAQLVNERKRRMECLERLIEWQQTVDGWEGPDLVDTCSVMIYSGEVTRATSTWSRDIIHLFLFDHLLIYCKKDLLKRNTFVYKGRINLTDSCMINLEDGKDSQFGITVKNAWKVYCSARDKWFLFYTKTSQEKEHWLKAFEDECMRVHEDKLQGFVVTEEAKKAARLALVNKSKPKRPRAKLPKGARPHPDTAVAELLLDPPAPKSRTGSLPSNLHPSVAVTTSSTHGPPKKKGSGWFHFGSSKKPKK